MQARLATLSPQRRAALEATLGVGSAATPEATGAAASLRTMQDSVDPHESFPLTEVQQAYWAGRQGDFELGNVGAELYLEYESINLDLARLEAAWQKVVERHPMLRAVVGDDGTQHVLPTVPPYRIVAVDLSTEPRSTIESEIERIRRYMTQPLSDLSQWPLFDIRLTLLPVGRCRLHLRFELIMFDAVSRQLMLAEWGQFYHDPSVAMTPPATTFRDWVLEAAARPRDAAEQYWRSRLATLPAAPELPRTATPGQRFVRRTLRFEMALWSRLKERASAAGLTAAALLLGMYAETLRVFSRSPHFTLNITTFNRPVADVVGDFTSLTLVEVEPGGDTNFAQRMQALQRRLWTDLEHRQVSAVWVMREMARMHGEPARARMPVVFTSHLLGAEPPAWLGELVYEGGQTPQVWLDNLVSEEDGALVSRFNYLEDMFPAGFIEDFLASYRRLVISLGDEDAWDDDCAQTHARLQPQALLASAEPRLGPDTLHTAFIELARAHPGRTAIVAPGLELSYGALWQRARQVGAALMARGLQGAEPVAVVMDKGWEQVVAVLGILAAGGAYVPLDASLPAARRSELLTQCRARFVVTQPAHAASLASSDPIVVTVEPPADVEMDTPEVSVTSLAYVIYTSGSSGMPKGVMIEHGAAANTIHDINERFSVTASDRVFGISSLSFDLSVWDIFGPLSVGAALVLPSAAELRDPQAWRRALAEHRITIWNSVPALMQLLVSEAGAAAALPLLRLVLLSGDWVPTSLPARVRALAPAARVISLGGATEASIWSILYPIEHVNPAWKSIPYGRAMRGQTVQVLDQTLSPTPPWTVGDIYIGGHGLARGYLHDAERTAASFIVHPRTGARLYRTGDTGRLLPDGNIEFLGREDQQVKVQGYRVELGEIEAALRQFAGVKEAVVVARGARGGERYLAAYVVATPQVELTPIGLREHLLGRLPAYMVPSSFSLLERLPLNATGKVDRRALPAPERSTARTASAETSSKTSEQLAILAGEVMAFDVGADDNLLELGGTSISMLRLANRIEQRWGMRPALDDLYRAQTPRAIAQLPCFGRHGREAAESAAPASTPALAPAPHALTLSTSPWQRQSQRAFSALPVPLSTLNALLALLSPALIDGRKRYAYGSASSLYAVAARVYLKPDRIAGLAGGWYAWQADERRLQWLCGDDLPATAFDPTNGQPVYEHAAFALFLVADVAAYTSRYGERGVHYATLETGAMTQLLETEARAGGIGLCQLGKVDEAQLAGALRSGPAHRLLHVVAGGLLPQQELPLSAAQRRLLLIERCARDARYNNVLAFRLHGALQPERLEIALQRVLQRHEVLRTACVMTAAGARQTVMSPAPFRLHVEDLSAERVDKRLQSEASRPFDLAEPPLLRASLWREASDRHVFLLVAHQFVADAWGMRNLLTELSRAYEGLPEPEIVPYATLAREELEGARADRSQQALEWWREQLRDMPPLWLHASESTDVRGKRMHFELPLDVCAEVRRTAKTHDTTAFTVLLAAFARLLGQWTQRDEVVVTTVASRRSTPTAETAVGTFANPLLLRVSLSENWNDVVATARRSLLEALQHQDVAFDALLAALGEQREVLLSHLRVLFVGHEETVERSLRLPHLDIEALDVECLSKTDLTIKVIYGADPIQVNIEFRPGVLSEPFVRALVRNLQAVVRQQGIEDMSLEAAAGPAHENSTAASMLNVWQQVLQRADFGPDEDFFTAGSSMQAVQLHTRLERWLGQPLPLDVILQNPTVNRLRAWLQQGSAEPRLITLSNGGTGSPVFFIHGLDGSVMWTRHVLRELAASRPLFGICARPADAGRPLEALAADYAKVVRAVTTASPILAGYSLGGSIAYEMARQLESEDFHVELVALCDTYGPGHPTHGSVGERAAGVLSRLSDLSWSAKFDYLRTRLRSTWKKQRSEARLRLSAHLPGHIVEGTREAFLRTSLSYVPGRYQGRVVLLRAAQQPAGKRHSRGLGWESVCARLDVVDVAGEHDTLYGPKYGPTLGRALRDALPQPELA